MKNSIKNTMLLLLLAVITQSWVHAGGLSVGTVFTYQGELLDSGSPANGEYDFLIQLYASQFGGSPVDFVSIQDLQISNGLLNVELDYGDLPFSGDEMFLQINVRPATSTGNFEPLDPRQRINVMPYAIQAEFVKNGSTPWEVNNGNISYQNSIFVGNPNTTSSSLLTVDSAVTVSPLRIKINGATKMILRDNGGTSLGVNTSVPDDGLRVAGDTVLNGNLTQDFDNFGVIKAALTVTCSSSSAIDKSFNAVNDQTFSIDGSIFTGNGACAIDFPFDLGDRFFVAMVKRQNDARVVSCNDFDNDTLSCVASDTDGNLINSIINILVY